MIQGKLVVGGLLGPEKEGVDPWYDDSRLFMSARPHGADPAEKYKDFVAIVRPDGTFTLDRLPPGDYDLKATLHTPRPENACGRGGIVGRSERTLSIAQDQTLDMGDLPLETVLPPQVGQPAPEISGMNFDRKPWTLGDERGAPALLVFWATWCAPCKAEIPLLKTIWKEYGEGGRLRIIGLNLDQDVRQGKEFAQSQGLPWPQRHIGPWSDVNPVAMAYGVSSIPSLWLIDADGKVLEAKILADALKTTLDRHLQ